MSKEELLELTGDVIEKLPNAMFRVRLENGVEILAHTAKCASFVSASWSATRSILK